MRGAKLFAVLSAAVATLVALPSDAQPAADAGTLAVSGAWVRAIPGAAVAAAYMTLHNGGARAVRVTGVRSALAGHAMIHESRLVGGVSTMRPHEPLTISPGESVELRP